MFPAAQEKARSGDPLGNLTRAMSEDHRVFTIAHYLLDHDIDAFRASLSESGRCQIELWQRKNNGEDIFYHFVNVGCFRYLFDTLAGGDFKFATELAQLMEGPVSNNFNNYIGFSLKYLVLGDEQRTLDVAGEYPFDNSLENYRAYHRAFEFIAHRTRNDAEFNDILARIDRAHRRDSRSRQGRFHETTEELLCLWGIGVANLAIHRGLVNEVTFTCDVLPNELTFRGNTT